MRKKNIVTINCSASICTTIKIIILFVFIAITLICCYALHAFDSSENGESPPPSVREENFCKLQHIKETYEAEVWGIACRQEAGDYVHTYREIDKIDDSDLLFLITLYFNYSVDYPRLRNPIQNEDNEKTDKTIPSEFEIKYYDYCCTLNAHAPCVRDAAIERLKTILSQEENQSTQKAKKIKAMLEYIEANMTLIVA